MTPRLTTDYAKNYCNRTLTCIVKVVVENVVTCFYGTQCSYCYGHNSMLWALILQNVIEILPYTRTVRVRYSGYERTVVAP